MPDARKMRGVQKQEARIQTDERKLLDEIRGFAKGILDRIDTLEGLEDEENKVEARER